MRIFLAAIVLLVVAYLVGFLFFVSALPTPPAMKPQADAIVALTGGDERLDTAVSLLEQGVGKRLLISGASMSATKDELGRISGGGRRFACCADIGYAAEDTHGNAEETAEWARAHKFDSLLIVTSRYHMPRALQEFGALLPDVTLIAYPVDAPGVDIASWWRHPRTAELLNREYLKYMASAVMTRLAHVS